MDTITLEDIIKWIGDNFFGLLSFISIFIEFSPIKINPISFILEWIWKPVKKDISDMENRLQTKIDNVRSDLSKEISELKKQQIEEKESIDEVVKELEMEEIRRIRWEIMEFANSIENSQLHTRDEYRHIKDDNRKYHALIAKYELENGITDESMQAINKHYEENKDSASVYF